MLGGVAVGGGVAAGASDGVLGGLLLFGTIGILVRLLVCRCILLRHVFSLLLGF